MTIQSRTIYTWAALCLMLMMGTAAYAQEPTDSLIINVGKSRIIFLVRDKADLETLKRYDLNQILRQLSLKLDNDTTGQTLVKEVDGKATAMGDTTVIVQSEVVIERDTTDGESEEFDEDNSDWRKRGYVRGWRHFFNIDLGTNNYVQGGKFPDETDEAYTVRPFGSWYVGISSTNHTYIGGPLYLEWGPSVSWYNFKFQNDKIRVSEGPDGVIFEEDVALPNATFKKSKLTVAYINFSAVPMFAFGKSGTTKKKNWWHLMDWNNDDRGFRIGAGGYAGYRIASYTKVVYEDGDKEKDKNKDNFHLNNFRYGLRMQMGYRGTDLFFNYDMNELFSEGKGPALNAFSFGITF